jgi:hypothetical protein
MQERPHTGFQSHLRNRIGVWAVASCQCGKLSFGTRPD